jgi:hypothetical protein
MDEGTGRSLAKVGFAGGSGAVVGKGTEDLTHHFFSAPDIVAAGAGGVTAAIVTTVIHIGFKVSERRHARAIERAAWLQG